MAAGLKGISQAAECNADLVLLPELSMSRYFCITEDHDNFDLAEPIEGKTTTRLQQAAKEHHIVVIGTVFEQRARGLYHNTAFIIDKDGTLAGTYRKMHIPDDPGFHEKYYFTPGEEDFRPVNTSIGKLGVLICWDQWFPEAARIMALAGAELLLFPSAIGWEPVCADFGIAVLQQRRKWFTDSTADLRRRTSLPAQLAKSPDRM